MPDSETQPTAARTIVKVLGDCDLADWHWTEQNRTLTLRFSWIGFGGGEGHDVVLCLSGVTRLVFECKGDSTAYYSIFDATLTQEVAADGGGVCYHLKTDGEVRLDVTCQTCEIFEQVALGDADVETAEAVEGMLP